MAYIPQQSDIDILRQGKRVTYSKIELLNKSFKVIDSLEGELVEDSYSIDADSDIRRTYNLTLAIKNSSFLVGSDKKIWFDKYIKVYIGLFSIRLRDVIYYPVGIYLFDSAGYKYDSSTEELTLSCVDRMAELTGDRNGKASGLSTKILANASIHDSLVSTVSQLGKIAKYRIDDVGKTVPYDLEFSTGASVYDIIKELRDLYPGWETYFDEEGFICQKYPTCLSDPIVLDAKTIAPLVISEDTAIKFTSVHNVIELWGKCLETDYFSDTVSYSSNKYTVTNSAVVGLKDGTMYGFKASATNLGNDSLQFNSLTAYPIICEGNAPITAGRIENGKSYVVEYTVSGSSGYFYFCGEYQIAAISKLYSVEPSADKKASDIASEPTKNISYVIEPDNPFCCDLAGMGEIRNVLSGSDYESIYSEDLATQRAKYELWKATDLLDDITLEMIEVPWLDVNQKIEYTAKATKQTEIYLVKKKSGSSSKGTMTIECTKFQPLYSWTN